MPYTEHWEGGENSHESLWEIFHTEKNEMVGFVLKSLVADLWLKMKQNEICWISLIDMVIINILNVFIGAILITKYLCKDN